MNSLSFTTDIFADYYRKFYVWDTCPIVEDRLEASKNMSRDYVKTQRARLEKFILPEKVCKIPIGF